MSADLAVLIAQFTASQTALIRGLLDDHAEKIAALVLAPTQPRPDEWLKADEAAALCKLSVERLETLRRVGGGPVFERNGRRVRYRRAECDAWLQKHGGRK